MPSHSTLLAITVFTPALAGCLLLLSWLQHRRVSALALWGSGFVTASVATTLIIVLRGTISDFWSIIVGNALLAAAYGILWSGARKFVAPYGGGDGACWRSASSEPSDAARSGGHGSSRASSQCCYVAARWPIGSADGAAAANRAHLAAAPIAPAEANSAAAVTPPVLGSGYAVQITSERSESAAQATFRELRARYPNQLGGRQPIIRRADRGAAGIYYRALVGPFASAEKAAKLCNGLKAAGGDCIILKN